MSVERMLGWRFMLLGTERGSFSPMTLFAWLAIGVGTGTMCALLSVMYGLESSIRDSLLKAYPHVMIRMTEGQSITGFETIQKTLDSHHGVKLAVPFVELEMIAQTRGKASGLGVVIWGLPAAELEKMRKQSEFSSADDALLKDNGLPKIMVGAELAHFLKSDVGTEVRLISPLKRTGALGSLPESYNYIVSGLYASESYDLDKQYIFMLLEDAQELMTQPDSITGWRIWVDDLDNSRAVAKSLNQVLPKGLVAQSWQSFNAALFESLQLEQWGMFLVLSFAVFIAVLNVAITLMMHVTHKTRNIGILRALGISRTSMGKVFLWQGVFLGLVGMILGAVLSFTLLMLIQKVYQFPDIYYVRRVPVEVRPLSVVAVYIVAFVSVVVATLYPAWRATTFSPVEAMRE